MFKQIFYKKFYYFVRVLNDDYIYKLLVISHNSFYAKETKIHSVKSVDPRLVIWNVTLHGKTNIFKGDALYCTSLLFYFNMWCYNDAIGT